MVAIKDMEMPKGCVSCNFCTDDWCCKIQHKYINNLIPNHINRDPNCPLVEIEERKVGKWIDGGRIYKGTFNKRYKCSNCQDNIYEKEYLIKYHKYCLRCGAEMRGAEDGN